MLGYRLIKETELIELLQIKWSMHRLHEYKFWPNQRFVYEFLEGFLKTPNGSSMAMWNLRDKFDEDLKAYVEREREKEIDEFDACI